MLNTLAIKNFIIVEYQEIEFRPGLNIVTGETGTGKSLLVNALLLLLGSRFREEWIRQGEDTALIEGCFAIAGYTSLQEQLRELGLDSEVKDRVVISREISRTGKSKTRLNGRVVPAQMAKNIASRLVDIYAQGDQLRFLDPENKIAILDTFLSEEGKETRKTYQGLFKILQAIEENLQKLNRGQEGKIKEYEEILQEMEEGRIDPQRVEEVEEEFRRLSSSQSYLEAIDSLIALLQGEGEGAFLNHLAQIKGLLRNLPDDFPFFSPSSVLETLERVEIDLRELSYSARRAQEAFSFSPARIEELERDIGEIERLKRKYRLLTTADLLSFREKTIRELAVLKQEIAERERLEKEKQNLLQEIWKVGEKLTQERKRGTQTLREKVEKELKELAFRKVEFIPLLERLREPGPSGLDQITFLVSLNPGELPLPVEEVASGGELSRIILALKSLTSNLSSVPTLIFDEIDQGIGGRTALWVGSKLRKLSQDHQVICITHLPQIAVFAHHHLKVEKLDDSQRTWTQVSYLQEKEERLEEIARMMGGEDGNISALKYAEILMEKVQNESP
ncbi:MAG: DNA repair protein RecN [Candidatus Caldatribacteriaceae bacterium]